MLVGMTVVKLAISLPEELVQKARRGIRAGQAKTMSAYVASAVKEKAEAQDLVEMLDEILGRAGPARAAAAKRWAARTLDRVTSKRPRRRKSR